MRSKLGAQLMRYVESTCSDPLELHSSPAELAHVLVSLQNKAISPTHGSELAVRHPSRGRIAASELLAGPTETRNQLCTFSFPLFCAQKAVPQETQQNDGFHTSYSYTYPLVVMSKMVVE